MTLLQILQQLQLLSAEVERWLFIAIILFGIKVVLLMFVAFGWYRSIGWMLLVRIYCGGLELQKKNTNSGYGLVHFIVGGEVKWRPLA